MANEPTAEELKTRIDTLTKQIETLKNQQTHDAVVTKAQLDAFKEQMSSQYALSVAQAQLPFAELQGIKAGIEGLKLPAGREGTIEVAAGTAGTALLCSKKPMLELLDEVADTFVKLCDTNNGVVLLTETQLAQTFSAGFTSEQISTQTKSLEHLINKMRPNHSQSYALSILPVTTAAVYTVGFVLDTINSLSKLFRTDRKINVFSADDEASQMLGYLLESKNKGFIMKPTVLDETVRIQAEQLLEGLKQLEEQVHIANDILTELQKSVDKENITVETSRAQDISSFKAAIDHATSFLDSLHPAKKPDAFWAQVTGQFLAAKIQGKQRLFIEAKAHVLQLADVPGWGLGQQMGTIGEIQVAYRLLNADGSLARSGIILRASQPVAMPIDELDTLNFPAASRARR